MEKKTKSYQEMDAEELAEATAEFDKEFIADTFSPPTPEQAAQWARMKGGSPREVAAVEVFHRIAQRWASRAEDIAMFVRTGYSFEEWMNWEAVAASGNHPNWEVKPKPRYKDAGIAGRSGYGDLLAKDVKTGIPVLVETKLVHDWTGAKWLPVIDDDSDRLAPCASGAAVPLQIIAAASKVSVEGSPRWQKWLKKLHVWNIPSDLIAAAALPPKGQLLIRGWTCEP